MSAELERAERHFNVSVVEGKRMGVCPLCGHRSLSLKKGDKLPVVGHCFVCGTARKDELTARIMEVLNGKAPVAHAQPQKTESASGLTLDQYCELKAFDKAWLVEHFDVSETTYNGKPAVVFPNGIESAEGALPVTAKKVRFGPSSHDSRWLPGDQGKTVLVPYGLWREKQLAEDTYLILVEGESDTQTLWFYGYPALGISGTEGWKAEWAELPLIRKAERTYIVREPDAAGDKFVQRIAESVPPQKIFVVRMPLEFPDPNSLHYEKQNFSFDDPEVKEENFTYVFDGLLEQATPLVGEVATPGKVGQPDMPPEVLDGWLGEVCRKHMVAFPIAFAWPALVTVAGLFVPPSVIRTNLYCALVSPWGLGKSSAIEVALWLLGIGEEHPLLVDMKAGSAEGMAQKIGDVGGAHRLFFPDELGHLFAKAQIEGASFSYVLNTAFNKTRQTVVVAKRKAFNLNVQLSIAGGIVDELFEDAFGSETTGGLHSRFIFGLCPTGYRGYSWRPVKSYAQVREPDAEGFFSREPVAVAADPDVWQEKDRWERQYPEIPKRMFELGLRVATICAAWDGRDTLRAADLGPALAFARYQHQVRAILKPNPGENFDARAGMKLLAYLDSHVPAADGIPGKWVSSAPCSGIPTSTSSVCP